MHTIRPTHGYAFPAKQDAYRVPLMDFEDTILRKVPVQDRCEFYLESAEGLETQARVQRGYRPERLYACTWNGATLANCTRRLSRLGITGYHRKAAEAITAAREWEAEGVRFHVVNLDLCGWASVKTLKTITDFPRAALMDNALMAVTVLMGRETPAARDRWDEMQGWNRKESADFARYCTTAKSRFVFGQYTPADAARWTAFRKQTKRWLHVTSRLDAQIGHGLNEFDVYRLNTIQSRMLGLDFRHLKIHEVDPTRPRPRLGTYRSGTQTMLWMAMRIPKAQ